MSSPGTPSAGRASSARRARSLALNHPHICTLYDIGREDGVDYLVLEYLEGETLADRLSKGALPLEQALRLGAQLADALGKAHRAGIVHRDVKPGNVMLTKSGPKLLDFGLARVEKSRFRFASGSMLPTQAKPLTQEGAILGTFQYMAPEQLEGNEADERTDIWALGLVIYEMVTGQKAFSGKSQASLIGAILKEDATSARANSADDAAGTRPTWRELPCEGSGQSLPECAKDLAHQLRWVAEARDETVNNRSTSARARFPWRSPERWALS